MLTLPRAFDAVPNSGCLAEAIRGSISLSDTFVCVVLEMRHVKSFEEIGISIVRCE